MIEFKAECGHTVRAKDEDAGGVVRCSYCGRPAAVPENRDDVQIDLLFHEVEEPRAPLETPPRRDKGRFWGMFARRRRGPDEFDPFALIAKLCWAAALISVVYFVGYRWVLPLFEEGGLMNRSRLLNPHKPEANSDPPAPTKRARRRADGLIPPEVSSGLYVTSTPPGADIYYIKASNAPTRSRIITESECQKFNPESPPRGEGEYVVEVVFHWGHPQLKRCEGYKHFRLKVLDAPDSELRKLAAGFFLPDEASEVLIDKTEDQIYIVRRYRNVKVRRGRLKAIRALFLPKLLNDDGVTFDIKRLVDDYLPPTTTYPLDREDVWTELELYGVPPSDRQFVMEALARIGVIPYVTPERRVLLFKIGIRDRIFAMSVIGRASG